MIPINERRQIYEHLFDVFDDCLGRIADQEGLVFERRAGPNIGRALRFKDDRLERGVFIELKAHWMKSDPVDPEIVMAYGARFRPNPVGFPVYLLSKVYYEGKLSGLTASIKVKAKLAVSEVKLVSLERIMQEGKKFEDWPQTDE
jgi:hypothetical protein